MYRFLPFLLLVFLAFPCLYWNGAPDDEITRNSGLIEVTVRQRSCLYKWHIEYWNGKPGGVCLYPFGQMDQFEFSSEHDGRKRCHFVRRGQSRIPLESAHLYVFLEDKELPIVYEFSEEAQKNGLDIPELNVCVAVREESWFSKDGEEVRSHSLFKIEAPPTTKKWDL